MKNPHQASLFDKDSAPVPASTEPNALLKINAAGAKLSAAQKTFNRLIAQIATERASLQSWNKEAERLHERKILELVPLVKQLRKLQHTLALQIDALLLSPPQGIKLTAARKRALTHYLLDLVDEVLDSDPDNPELHALHDRHSEEDLATIREMDRNLDMDIAEDMLKAVFGAKMVDRKGANDFEELIRQTHERVDQAQSDAPAPKRNKREQAAADKRKAAEEALSQSLREVYRKLASSLHPDRETDAELRTQKTLLMQRINIAYQEKDLLALLTLQLEVEQISTATLGQVSEQRLAQYNQILREQLATIKTQQRDLIAQLEDELDAIEPYRAPTVARFDAAIASQKKHLQSVISSLNHCNAEISDPRRALDAINGIVAAIKKQEQEDRRFEREEARMARHFGF